MLWNALSKSKNLMINCLILTFISQKCCRNKSSFSGRTSQSVVLKGIQLQSNYRWRASKFKHSTILNIGITRWSQPSSFYVCCKMVLMYSLLVLHQPKNEDFHNPLNRFGNAIKMDSRVLVGSRNRMIPSYINNLYATHLVHFFRLINKNRLSRQWEITLFDTYGWRENGWANPNHAVSPLWINSFRHQSNE